MCTRLAQDGDGVLQTREGDAPRPTGSAACTPTQTRAWQRPRSV